MRVRGFLLDTNVFNHLIDGKIARQDLPEDFPIFVTHLQRKEILATKDGERRKNLISLVNSLPDDCIELQTCLAGVMRAGDRVGNGKIFREILNFLNAKKKRKTKANTYDALIGEVAIVNNYILITNDQDLGEKVRDLGGYVRDQVKYRLKS